MNRYLLYGFFALSIAAFSVASGSAQTAVKFDEFGLVNSESEMLRLDAFAVDLNNRPNDEGYIIVYAGRKSRSTETKTAIKRMLNYLVRRRGQNPDRLKMIDGGRRKTPLRELWLVPESAPPPKPRPTVEPHKGT